MLVAVSDLWHRCSGFKLSREEESARRGGPPLRTFWRVTLPGNMPGILACLLRTFTISLDEFFMALFLSGSDRTLPMYIWGQLRFPQDFPSLLALSSLILLFSFVLIFASLRLAKIGQPSQTEAGR